MTRLSPAQPAPFHRCSIAACGSPGLGSWCSNQPTPAVMTAEWTQTASAAYTRQRATIAEAVERLQNILDNMLTPSEDEITWADVAHYAHVAESATALNEVLKS